MLVEIGLFAGIGGMSLGLERAGLSKPGMFCEIDPYCQKVLNKHWPEIPTHNDIKTLTGEMIYDYLRKGGKGEVASSETIITGGFP